MLKAVVRALGSGTVVYLLVVACSSSSAEQRQAGVDGEQEDGGFGGAPAEGDSRANVHEKDGGIVDALVNPVPDAYAADAPQVSGGVRLKPKFQVGEDGSKQFVGWFDSKNKDDCAHMNTVDGKTRCIPYSSSTAVTTGLYSDAKCTNKLAAVPITQACPNPNPKYAHHAETSTTCPPVALIRMFQIGAKYVSNTAYSIPNGVCKETNVERSYVYFNVVGEISPTEFVASTIEVGL